MYINRDTPFILYPVLPVHSFVMTKFPPSTKLLSCNKICAPLFNRFVKAIEPSLIVATMFYYKRIRDTTRTKCVTRKRKRRPRLNCAAMLLILVSRRTQWANAGGICNRRRWSKPIPTAIHHRCALRIPLRKIEGYRPICFSRVLLHETYAEYFKRVKKHNRRNGKKHVKETIRKKEEATIIGIDCR